jgi:protein TonB
MFGLDLPRCGLLVGVGLAHAAVAFAFAQMRPPERPNSPVVFAETLFFPESQPKEEPPPPVVQIQSAALRFDTPIPQLAIESVLTEELPPSPKAPKAIVSTAPSLDQHRAVQVESIEYVRPPQPRYPPLSRRLKEQGVVVLKVLVNERGEAQHIEVEHSSGHERLDRAAVEAVAAATFRPLLENGVPRAMLVLIPIEFGLHRART